MITLNITLTPELFDAVASGRKRMVIHRRNPRIDRYFDAKTPERALIRMKGTAPIARGISRIRKTRDEWRLYLHKI